MRDNKYNEDRRRWRALTFDYDRVLEQEDLSGTLHCLSATTRLLVMSMLPYISWPTRYDGEGIDKDRITGWADKAADELGGDMIRQNPANSCQLQMSCDGVTWTTVMDWSLCLGATTPTQAASYDAELSGNRTTYDDDLSNLTDKWDYDGTYPAHFTNDALCWAIHQYVAMVCSAQADAIRKKNEEANFYEDLSSAFGLVSGVAGLMAAVGAFPISAAVGAAALGLGAILLAMGGEFDDEDESLFEDQDTIDDISCEILAQMVGTKPVFAAWSTALNIDSTPVNDYVYGTMQSEDLFFQFLLLTADMVVVAETNDLPCPCPESPWTAFGDFEVAMLPDFVTVNWGNFIPLQGVHGINHQDSGNDATGSRISIETNDPYTQTRVRMHYDNLANCGGAPGSSQQAHIANGENTESWTFGEVGQGSGHLDNDSVEHVDGVSGDCRTQLRSCHFGFGGTSTQTGVTVQGTGYNPFDGASGWAIT